MKKVFLILTIGFAVISCNSSKRSSGNENVIVENNSTAGLYGDWQLQMLFASDNKWERAPYLNINMADKTFSGNSSCNSISGKFTIIDNTIIFDKNMVSTKMACPGSYENAFLSALLKINRYSIIKEELELRQGEIVLMKFRRTAN